MSAEGQWIQACEDVSGRTGRDISYSYGVLGSSSSERSGHIRSGHMTSTAPTFDLASLTKVISSPMIFQAIRRQQKLLSLLESYGFPQDSLDSIFRHQAGYEAWKPFYLTTDYHSSSKERMHNLLSAILSCHPIATGRRLYSDVGLLILQILIENVLNINISKLFMEEQEKFFPQARCHYRPLDSGISSYQNLSPTEECMWRDRLILGQVHDSNCYCLNGVGLHAGLFGRLGDVQHYALGWLAYMLSTQTHKSKTMASENTEDPDFLIRCLLDPDPLFFDRATVGGSTDGLLSTHARGHLGYTGTSVWVDPNFSIGPAYFVLLTNWTYPNDDDRKGLLAFRQMFHRFAVDDLMST